MKDGKYVILCVDDDEDILFNLRTVLEPEGYFVVEAKTGEEGLKKYKEYQPDFIIVDLMMEESDAGTNFAKELKALGNSAPVYMLSSLGDQFYRSIDYNEYGLQGVFQKPIDPQTLLSTIKIKLKQK